MNAQIQINLDLDAPVEAGIWEHIQSLSSPEEQRRFVLSSIVKNIMAEQYLGYLGQSSTLIQVPISAAPAPVTTGKHHAEKSAGASIPRTMSPDEALKTQPSASTEEKSAKATLRSQFQL